MQPLFNERDGRIAKALGVTGSGLKELSKAVARPGGDVYGGVAAFALCRKGLCDETLVKRVSGGTLYIGHVINDAGREIVRRARSMGW